MSLRDDVLQEIEAFLSVHEMEPSTFGRIALNDPNFVRNLRAGRRIWPETADRVRGFMQRGPDQSGAQPKGRAA